MAWNEPGRGNQPDPWRQGDGKRNGGNQPPDLDKLLGELQGKFKLWLGGKGNGNGGSGNNKPSFTPPSGPMNIKFGAPAIAAVIFGLYLLSGIYIVAPAERAAVFQFGRFVKEVGPGPHWLPSIIRSKKIVNVEQVHTSRHSNLMLTKDENIVFVELTVQYRVGNLEHYLFSVVDPVYSLEEATDSALRQVVGVSTLDEILTEQRAKVRDEIRKQLDETLALYKAGLLVTDVALQPARAPNEVKEAFDDAIKAQEDEQRMINQAQAYRERIVPIAQGQAERILADARANASEVQLRAAGDVERFDAILPEYKKAPGVTRKRMYMDTMEKILGDTSKIVVDTKGGNNVFYLPLEQIMKEAEKLRAAPDPLKAPQFSAPSNAHNNIRSQPSVTERDRGGR
jgi:membrane protease subunit HflK